MACAGDNEETEMMGKLRGGTAELQVRLVDVLH